MSTTDVTELEVFAASAQRVVDYLRTRTPLTDWSVSRIDTDDQVHLHVSGVELLHRGDRVPYSETFCRRMLGGAARVVPDSLRNIDYADLSAAVAVGAYAGVPIVDPDGLVFGSLCGARAEALSPGETVDQELLEVLAELLSDQLGLVYASAAQRRSAVVSAALASSDALTGLMNRRGWDLVVVEAQGRVHALGDHGGVIMIDLDDLKAVNDIHGHRAGDALLSAAGAALRGAAPLGHAVARYGGDEFVVYTDGTRPAELANVARRYADALAAAGVAASMGFSPVLPEIGSVRQALSSADEAMYADKRRRRAERGADAQGRPPPRGDLAPG